MEAPFGDLPWAELQADFSELQRCIVSLFAVTPTGIPRLIGTAFIVSAMGDSAVCLTAAHNFWDGVSAVQYPRSKRHASALPEFIPNFERVDLDRRRLRAVLFNGNQADACVVTHAWWVKGSDIGIFKMELQDRRDGFKANIDVDVDPLRVGDLVCVAGWADLEVQKAIVEGDYREATFSQRLAVRAGRVAALHPDGHILCRGPCLETSIPVFGGMSGGVAFRLPQGGAPIRAFGVISSDPEEDEGAKKDWNVAGASIVALLPILDISEDGENRTVRLLLADANFVSASEEDGQTGLAAAT